MQINKLKPNLGKLIVPFLALVLVAMFSAGCFQDLLIPTYIAHEAIEYDDANDMSSVTSFFPWPTLWDAKQLAKRMQRKNEIEQRDLGRLLVDKASHYAYVAKGHYTNIQDAEQFKQTVFSPTGPIGLLVPTLAAFGIGAMGVSKPRDKRKLYDRDKKIIDLEKTVIGAVADTTTVS